MALETAAASAAPRCAAASSGRKWLTAWRAEGTWRSDARSAASASSRRAHARALAGLPALRSTTGLPALRSAAGRLLRHDEHPLVVMVAPLIKTNRLVLALAADPHDAADHGAATERARGLGGGRQPSAAGRPADGPADRLPSLAGLPRPHRGGRLLSGLTGHAPLADKLKVVVGNGIFVFLTDKPACHKQIDAAGHRLRAGLVQTQRAHVLLAAEDQFFFLFALRLLAPDRQRDRHQHRHHRQRNQQGGHGKPGFGTTRLTTP